MTKLQTRINDLYWDGLSNRAISKECDCTEKMVEFYLNRLMSKVNHKRRKTPAYKAKHKPRSKIPKYFIDRVTSFKKRKSETAEEKYTKVLKRRIYTFTKGNNMFTPKELLEKISKEPKCWITGKSIELKDTSSWQLDHKVPKSQGGENTLENCDIATKDANSCKGPLLMEDFISICIQTLENHGFSVDVPD